MNNPITSFFGGPPIWVLLRLILLSVIVGLVLSVLGISPYLIVRGFQRLAAQIYDMGFGAIRLGLDYFLIGAIIVFPVWLVMRLVKSGSRSTHRD
ncbi:DUF6460 domain-containing protein [Tepidamorphus sp. 3E244]|uniref:DUF6460 domain-containing protein n=1 Tax=Tepidamorphus sp. 3E244 TaxID=3385498 RepID=UPI0038FCDABD